MYYVLCKNVQDQEKNWVHVTEFRVRILFQYFLDFGFCARKVLEKQFSKSFEFSWIQSHLDSLA